MFLNTHFKFKKFESDMFTLLPKQESHECQPISKFNEGPMYCASSHILVKSVPNIASVLIYKDKTMQKFLYRDRTLQTLVKALSSHEHPLVSLRGSPGLGKSTMLRNAFQYIIERKYFAGGVILIDMKHMSVLRQLM